MCLSQSEIATRLKAAFQKVSVDWNEGNRWVEARIAKAIDVGYDGSLLAAEHSLRDQVALVSILDQFQGETVSVKFYMTPDTGMLELHYDPFHAVEMCRTLAGKISEKLGYELSR